MSIGTIVGIIGGIGLFIGAILMSTNNFLAFIDIPSVIMVLGGTTAATFVSYEARYVILSLKSIYKIYTAPAINRNLLKAEVGRVIRWGYTVQKSGLPALESETGKLKNTDKFLAFGVDMVVAGYTGQEVREILTTTIETTFGRNTIQATILRAMGGAAPAFGMIGTLIGLIIMLGNLEDPTALGPALSVALITTLYGVLFARLLFIPAATKVQQ
ncbi:MAG: MotA/TolQ/ExbB proton channel family protein, partial [Rhodospirillales bacterium]|nr:MotA/TolQ/ExbB proton channel family protein [Rhodospirillales bacterium]